VIQEPQVEEKTTYEGFGDDDAAQSLKDEKKEKFLRKFMFLEQKRIEEENVIYY